MKRFYLILAICLLSIDSQAGWDNNGLQPTIAYAPPTNGHNLPQKTDINNDETENTNDNVVNVKEHEIESVTPPPTTTEEAKENILLSKREQQRLKRLNKIQEMRANETSRFKQKAIANTEAREKRNEEALKRRSEKASPYQKAALENMEKENQLRLQNEQQASPSRFTEKAKRQAEARALQKELREAELHRNRE